ncbi:hypothetical protein, partial [Ectothiorhodospira haloalkaliphila]
TEEDANALAEALTGKFAPGSQPQLTIVTLNADGSINDALNKSIVDIVNAAGTKVVVQDADGNTNESITLPPAFYQSGESKYLPAIPPEPAELIIDLGGLELSNGIDLSNGSTFSLKVGSSNAVSLAENYQSQDAFLGAIQSIEGIESATVEGDKLIISSTEKGESAQLSLTYFSVKEPGEETTINLAENVDVATGVDALTSFSIMSSPGITGIDLEAGYFVLKNPSDAYVEGNVDDQLKAGFEAPNEEKYGANQITLNIDQFNNDVSLQVFGMTLGGDMQRSDTLKLHGLGDLGEKSAEEALLDVISTIEVAHGQSQYANIFQDKSFLSVKLAFEAGGSIELIDLVALDVKVGGTIEQDEQSIDKTVEHAVNEALGTSILSYDYKEVENDARLTLIQLLGDNLDVLEYKADYPDSIEDPIILGEVYQQSSEGAYPALLHIDLKGLDLEDGLDLSGQSTFSLKVGGDVVRVLNEKYEDTNQFLTAITNIEGVESAWVDNGGLVVSSDGRGSDARLELVSFEVVELDDETTVDLADGVEPASGEDGEPATPWSATFTLDEEGAKGSYNFAITIKEKDGDSVFNFCTSNPLPDSNYSVSEQPYKVLEHLIAAFDYENGIDGAGLFNVTSSAETNFTITAQEENIQYEVALEVIHVPEANG